MRDERQNDAGLLLLFCIALLAFFYRALEILNAFAEALAEVGQLARSEDKKCDAEQQ